MAVLITIIIFLGSLMGMGVILYRKTPALSELPEIQRGLNLKTKILKARDRVKAWRHSKLPPFDILLQKILSKIRILSLKAEKKSSLWLQRLREKSAKRKENDKYWQELKDSIDKKKSGNDDYNLPS